MPPEEDFLSLRTEDSEQWKWMVGEDFHALKMQDAVSPKLRVPSQAYAFDGFGRGNQIEGEEFITVGSLAKGGLSNAWGCGIARLSVNELAALPFPGSEMIASYAKVSRRIGISGRANDDMADYFGLDEFAQPPIPMDELHSHLYARYAKRRTKLRSQGFKLGRSRVAALSADISDRQACNLSGNCLWGCSRRSLYSAIYDLAALRKHANFIEISGFVVDGLSCDSGCWEVKGQTVSDGERRSVTAEKVVLAAGTLATTRIVLSALNHRHSVPLLSSPTAAFLLWVPRLLGAQRMPGFGLGQLSFALSLRDDINAFGSTFSTTGILMYEFARHVPMARRYGIDFLKGLLSSCVVGNLFLPGHLTKTEISLRDDKSLIVSGTYGDTVIPLMDEARKKLRNAYWSMGALLLPGSFTVGRPGGDIHYAGTLPMRDKPVIGDTTSLGEVKGMDGVYVVDGACLPIFTCQVAYAYDNGKCRPDWDSDRHDGEKDELLMKRKILCVVGTRPEAIKMAPVISGLERSSPGSEVRVLATAQHRHMLDQVMTFFGITPDIDLNIMKPNQTLTELTARLLLELNKVLLEEKPDFVLAQGDTTTVFAMALACFYNRIPFGHVEAGLRTWDMQNPFPEEANRVIAGKLARWHFAPTEGSRQNLLREGVPDDDIFVTGNTVIDALLMTAAKDLEVGIELDPGKRLVLVTSHRRENFGEPFGNICRALRTLAENNADVQFLYPVHPNPNVKDVAHEILGDCSNIRLCEPLDYAPFVAAMKRAYLIISDSGGVQEEAPALGKPVLVLRDETERPEAVEQGVVKLVGPNYERIVFEVQRLLDDEAAYREMARGISPYGDGHATERIVKTLREHFA